MTVGIYCMYWPDDPRIYVGQSVKIEDRWTRHRWDLKNGSHSNLKVQRMYNKYGEPSFRVLEVCDVENLNSLEIHCTSVYDSITNGLNVVEAGNSAYGVNSKHSVYSMLSILKVFALLSRTSLPYNKVALKTRVKVSTVNDISIGKSHRWLEQKYPESYKNMLDRLPYRRKVSKPQKNGNSRCKTLVSPEGIEYYDIKNVLEFCKTVDSFKSNPKNHVSKLSRVFSGQRPQHLGWKLKQIA